jgi:non-ribosomal peptide synthetase component E (peptide arylation enzyme)
MAEFTFAPLTPASFLHRAAAVFADRTAIVDGERRFTSRCSGTSAGSTGTWRYVRERLARYKVPKRFEFGELPKTSTGKIQKNVLRDRARELEES